MALLEQAKAQAETVTASVRAITEADPGPDHVAACAAAALAATAVVALASIADSLAQLTAVFAAPGDGAT